MHSKARPWVACCLGIATNFKPQRNFVCYTALRLARGEIPLRGPIDGAETPGGARPDDLAEITYLDHFGNAMTGISLGLDSLPRLARQERVGIEAQLLLGASRWRAMRYVAQRALRTAFTPMLNSMAAAGVVFLPGMMTGQILAGAAPDQAVKYQILVLLLIAGATGLGVLTAVMASIWRVTDGRHRLRLDRLR